MKNLSTSDIQNIKEKLVKLKNEIFNKDKNKKTNLYKAAKIKNLVVTKIKIIKDLNEYKGIKNIWHLFNDNIYEGIIDIRYFFNGVTFNGIAFNEVAFNEDFYIENTKSEF